MKVLSRLSAVISLCIFATLVSVCTGNQVAEANEYVAEANKYVAEANNLIKKTERKNKELFAPHIQTHGELKIYREKMKAAAEIIVADFGKAADLMAKASENFDRAGKLDVPEKFKEYLQMKFQEFAKRAAAVNARQGNARAFLDDDLPMAKKFEENNEKVEKLMKQARAFEEIADQIQSDNREFFDFRKI